MKKLFYYISRIFFSKEKLLLIRLLTLIQESTTNNVMYYSGMCAYISEIGDQKDYLLLSDIIFKNEPEKPFNHAYFFKPYAYEPRFEFLKTLIKKY